MSWRDAEEKHRLIDRERLRTSESDGTERNRRRGTKLRSSNLSFIGTKRAFVAKRDVVVASEASNDRARVIDNKGS